MGLVTELGDGVWQISCTGVNAYLADEREGHSPTSDGSDGADGDDEGSLTLVDAGTPRDGARIRRAVDEAGYGIRDIDRVLVTHYDVDHVGALAGLLEVTGAECYVGAADAGFLMHKEKPPFFHHKGALQRVAGRFAKRPDDDPNLVADEDEIGTFTAYHTPGHTPGHTAYVSEALNVAFVGDLVFERDGQLTPSPWTLSYDTDTVEESIHDFADREPAIEIVAMGHGVPFVRDGAIRLAELGERLEREKRQ